VLLPIGCGSSASPLLLRSFSITRLFHAILGPSSTPQARTTFVSSQSLHHLAHRCLTPPRAIAAQARSRIQAIYPDSLCFSRLQSSFHHLCHLTCGPPVTFDHPATVISPFARKRQVASATQHSIIPSSSIMILLGLRRENHIVKHHHWPHLGIPAPPDAR
jgi:hypothetical protein